MIRVGRTSQMVETIPVKVVHDMIYEASEFPETVLADRFQILDVDGYFLVIQESLYSDKPSQQKFKCFLMESDAWAYLDMFGIERDEE